MEESVTPTSALRFDSQPGLPLVSVVTPSLNAARFIEQTIESVLTQNYPHIEYIVLDGGSTDGTIRILDRYRERLRYVVQKDGGAAEAINRGFRQSQGAIFSWLGADDVYVPGAVARVVARFSAEPDAAVVYRRRAGTVSDDGSLPSRHVRARVRRVPAGMLCQT
jgi:glycosyltransferase involved in cell wall biosynthesis